MDTDADWEEWGRLDPYFGVLTDPKFRRDCLTQQARQEFFDSGRLHADYVIRTAREHLDENFQPRTILDFGCGVGRTLVAFAQQAREVVGLDVSSSMLEEARLNCGEYGVTNARLLLSDDALSLLTNQFDLIHSCIVFQHIPLERGIPSFSRLLRHLRPGGIGAFQVTYSKSSYATTNGVAPVVHRSRGVVKSRPLNSDPEIQMNAYNMNEWLFLMQRHGVVRFLADFTDHGGELGLFLFFKSPEA